MGPSYTSGTVVGPVAPQGDIVLPSSKSGSGKKVAIIVVIVLLVLVAVGVGIWFFVNRESGFGGTAEQRFNRFANYLLYEEDSDEWTHGEEEFSMDLADDFEDRFYTYSEEEWGNYMGKVKKLWENFINNYDDADSYIEGVASSTGDVLYGIDEIFGYINTSDSFDDEVYYKLNSDGWQSATTLIDERYEPLVTSDNSLASNIGKVLEERSDYLLETYVLSEPSEVTEDLDGNECYVFDRYGCLSSERTYELLFSFNSKIIMRENEQENLVDSNTFNLAYSAWLIAKNMEVGYE